MTQPSESTVRVKKEEQSWHREAWRKLCIEEANPKRSTVRYNYRRSGKRKTTQITKRLMVSEGMRERKSQTVTAVSLPLSQVLTKVTFEFNERASAECVAVSNSVNLDIC